MSLQAQIYKNDLLMSLGSDTRPPILINENEFEQWQDRFINFIERQPNGENMMKSLYEGLMVKKMKVIPATATTPATTVETPLSEYDEKELSRYKADSLAKSNLILALPNSIYNRIDCFKHNPMLMWTQLEKIMLGTAMSTQLRQARFMNNFEKFQAKDGESLKSVFDRFWAVINDLFKIKVTKTELEANLKFLNALQPEWNKSCHRMRNDVRISTMPIQELYEILMTDESMIMEKKAKMDKKNKPQSVDPIALIASQLVEQTLTESAYDGSTDDDGEALEKAMTLLTQLYQKRFKNRSGSNNLQFTSGSNTGSSSKTYTPKYEQAKTVDQKKDDKKVINCFNCGKPGHMVKDCRVKVVKNADFYRKKLALAEKKESGTVLLAEDEYWLDHSVDEADNEEVAAMCFVGDDQSDDEEDDTSSDGSEVISDFNYHFFLSQMNVFITALHDLRAKLVSEKFKNQEKFDFIEKLQISLNDEKSILIDTKEKFQKQLVDLEKSNQTYHDSLTELTSSNQNLSEKIIVLERKLYKREQSEQTIYMNKPRSEEAVKQRWGLGFDNPHFLNKVIDEVPTLYKYEYLNLAHYGPQFKFFWTSEKQILDVENEKRIYKKKNEIPFVYTSENAKYFPDKSRRGKRALNDISSIKSSISNDFIAPYASDTSKENSSPIYYDSKKYIPPIVLEGKIIDLEDQIEDQNILKKIESDIILSFMTSSLEENIFSQKSDSISNISSDFKENKKEVSNFKNFSQNSSNSEASSSVSNAKTVFFDKVSSSDLIIDNSLLLNDQFYKKKRKRRRSRKSKKHDSVLSENYNVSVFYSSDRTVRKSPRQIWRKKQISEESFVDGDKCVDKLYYSDSFASCNKISKYSRKQMFRISKYVSCSSSDSNSDDYAFSSDECDYFSDHIPRALSDKSAHYFPVRTATNKQGPKFKWVPKSLSDSKLQASHVKGE
ncbi:hypothetical protein L6452_06957 [Arctium lappa]|uniref:Uncharacterized protein n=1 Tax=Arctium lappa TaxID=4217 RepID=A0ACB9EKX9_ARCLA|nr:hypothetical protein L6452_06957 [Arctium lappa]